MHDITGDLLDRAASLDFHVSDADSAPALGSGDVPVLATPRLVAWIEAATVAAVAEALPPGSTTVGTRVEIDHVAATPIGVPVQVSARVVAVDGRRVTFTCDAEHLVNGARARIGGGLVVRAVVERRSFVERVTRGPVV